MITTSLLADQDRQRCRLARDIHEMVINDDRRIVVSGASGWVGRTVLSLLHESLGAVEFERRVLAFGSCEKIVRLIDGASLRQLPLSTLPGVGARPSLMFHLAFMTKDKVAGMYEADYIAANRSISRIALAAADSLGVDRVFVASSGAAGFADDPSAAYDLRLYGRLKREEEESFAAWARAPVGEERRVAIARIFNVSGPFINKVRDYAIASFIADGLTGRTIAVAAKNPVFRSYVAVRDVVSLAFSCLLSARPFDKPTLRFDTGGESIEVGELAARVAMLLGARVERSPMTVYATNVYRGCDVTWRKLLKQYSVNGTSLDDQIIETAAYMSRELGGRETIAQMQRFN